MELVNHNLNSTKRKQMYTSTLWNTTERCRGFEDMKNKISSSLKASDIFGLFFFTQCATFGLKI